MVDLPRFPVWFRGGERFGYLSVSYDGCTREATAEDLEACLRMMPPADRAALIERVGKETGNG